MALQTSHQLQRFRFASFDAKEEKEAITAAKAEPAPELAPAGPIPLPLQLPAISEAELQTARAEAQGQGYREGYAAAQAKFDKESNTREEAIRTLMEIIANRITLAAEAHAQLVKGREDLMGRLVVAAARKVAGDAMRREPYVAVEALLKDCMNLLAGVPKLKVVVSSALAPGLNQRIEALRPLLQGFDGELVVEEDAALLDQDCRVEWGNGHAERNTENLWSAIEAVVGKMNVNS